MSMKPPAVDLQEHLDDVEFVAWRGQTIDVWHLYDTLTALDWKVDTEESNLMVSMSRVWRAEGIKVLVILRQFVCAPPDGEVEELDRICFYRFDPATMPATTMADAMYEPGDEKEPWYASHREEWSWLLEFGDPQSRAVDLLTPIALREVPAAIREEAWLAIEEGVRLASA